MIERGMEADDRERLFGDKSLDPAVEEPLPFTLLSSEPFPLLSCNTHVPDMHADVEVL